MSTNNLPTVLVVGAAGGIGKQTTLQLQGRARVIAVVQDAVQLAEISALVEYGVECDLADASSVQRTVAAISARTQAIAGLVFCAGMQPIGPLELVSRPELERLFAINLFGTVQLLQGIIPMMKQPGGRIVLFSSMCGRVGIPMIGAYCASKFALEGIADTLRRELCLVGVRLCLIQPGGVDTPMAAAQSGMVDHFLSRLDPDMEKRFGPLARGYRAMTEIGLESAVSPAAAAAVAVSAVMSLREPRARYVVGNDARVLILLTWLLPTRWFDAMMMKLTLQSGPRLRGGDDRPATRGKANKVNPIVQASGQVG
jgi:NAD(P)-dependent dehydrogenase (short-subunit alcohol dehydrogenase family)